MVESIVQSADALKLLPNLEAEIRNGAQLGVSPAVIERIEAHVRMRPDEKALDLLANIKAARSIDPSAEPQLAQAVLSELGERILERGEEIPDELALYAVEVIAGRIQEKRARGRPPRSKREKYAIYVFYKILIMRMGYTVGQAQREVADLIRTKPDAVSKIIRDWERSEREPSSETNSRIYSM